MDTTTVIDFALVVGVIVAMVEVVKMMGLPDRWAPAPALLMGVLAGMLYLQPDDWKRGAFVGLVATLSAVGAFSGTKNVIQAARGYDS